MTSHERPPGAPFATTAPPTELVISTFGQQDDGGRVFISGTDVIFEVAMEGMEVKVGVAIIAVLDAIAKYTHTHES